MAKKNTTPETPEQTEANLVAELKALKKQLAAAENRNKTMRANNTSIKVSAKGGLSVYGLGRFPATFYPTQWRRLANVLPEVLAAIDEDEKKSADKRAMKWDK